MIYPWQNKLWQQLLQQKSADKLPHALLFHGTQGVGKKHLAIELATSLLCRKVSEMGESCGKCPSCLLVAAQTHPDFYLIEPKPPEKSKSKHPVFTIKIDTIRDLCDSLAKSSQFGGYRVVIISGADLMMKQAANALLKTLEEPGRDTLIMLVTSKTYRIPVTLKSRCQMLRFSTPDNEQSLEWLRNNGVKQAEIALKISLSAPLLAKYYADNNLMPYRQIFTSAFQVTGTSDSVKAASQLAQIPKEYSLPWLQEWISDLGRIAIFGKNVQITNEDCRELLQLKAKKANKRRLFQMVDEVNSTIRVEQISLNLQLLWESLLISWESI